MTRSKGTDLLQICALVLILCSGIIGQEIAILAPENKDVAREFALRIETGLEESFPIVDAGLAASAMSARGHKAPFNMTVSEARYLGDAIGCRYLVLVKADTLRRSTFQRKGFYESFAAIYFIESRSGALIQWHLYNAEEDTVESALASLVLLAPVAVSRIKEAIKNTRTVEPSLATISAEDYMQGTGEPGFRPPMPYRRLKPAYTKLADFYGVEATVDILVRINVDGRVMSTKIVRWAGFGLDEAVEKTVREMNWRAAELGGKSFAKTVLLRYNFRDLDNEVPTQ